MKYFHGHNEKNGYFEGWYFKHRSEDLTLGIIAAYHIDLQGRKKASIQVITKDQSFIVWYPGSEFYASKDRLFIQIGNNIFYEHGCRLSINAHLKGHLRYGAFRPLAYDIMGPFQYLPGMQCRHGVISMAHKVSGSLTLNGVKVDEGVEWTRDKADELDTCTGPMATKPLIKLGKDAKLDLTGCEIKGIHADCEGGIIDAKGAAGSVTTITGTSVTGCVGNSCGLVYRGEGTTNATVNLNRGAAIEGNYNYAHSNHAMFKI